MLFLCIAIALRVSTTGHIGGHHQTWGSFSRTMLTLEEAVHGPDVSWRKIVETYPALTGAIFVCSLWVTLAMMSMLLAMFSTSYGNLETHMEEVYLFRRATWTIGCEKLFPGWFHKLGVHGGLLDHIREKDHGKLVVKRSLTRRSAPPA